MRHFILNDQKFSAPHVPLGANAFVLAVLAVQTAKPASR